MKVWIIGMCGAVLGTLVGFGLTQMEFAGAGDFFIVENRSAPPLVESSPDSDPSGDSLPRVFVIGGVNHDFGVMEKGVQGSHVFQIKNVGKAPLKLTLEGTTCKCTVGDLKTDVIQPGQVGDIELTYDTPNQTPEYRHGANIGTNDPQLPRLKLTVQGAVIQKVYATPLQLVFTRISSSEPTSASFGVFTRDVPDFEISKIEFLNPAANDFFEVEMSDAPKRRLESQAGKADAGKMITVRTKAGLPYGAIRETLRLTTNTAEETIDVPITGSVIADVSIVGGPRFNLEASLYTLGVVDQEKGASVRMLVLVKGPNREKTEIKLVSVEPKDVLQVELGEMNKREKVVSYPLVLSVPKGASPVSYLSEESNGFGRIVLETSDPRNKEIRIKVRFAVE